MKDIAFFRRAHLNQILPFNAWNAFFSPPQGDFVDDYVQLTLQKLLAAANAGGPQKKSFERAENFFKDAERDMNKL